MVAVFIAPNVVELIVGMIGFKGDLKKRRIGLGNIQQGNQRLDQIATNGSRTAG